MTSTVEDRLHKIAAPQFGVFDLRQAHAADVTDDELATRIRNGSVVRMLWTVYAMAHVAHAPTNDARCMAGVLFGRADAALSLETAAARLGIWKRPGPRISVACRRTRNMRPPAWLHLWRTTTLDIADVIVVDRIPCTNATRTICDLGRWLSPWELANVMHEAYVRRLLDLEAIRQMLRLRRQQPGTAVVWRAIDLHLSGSAGTRSKSEDRLLTRLLLLNIEVPLVNQRNATGVDGHEWDFVWPRFRLVVEVDGRPFHDGPLVPESEAIRERELRKRGWRILRFDSSRVWSDLDGVIREIRAAMFATLV